MKNKRSVKNISILLYVGIFLVVMIAASLFVLKYTKMLEQQSYKLESYVLDAELTSTATHITHMGDVSTVIISDEKFADVINLKGIDAFSSATEVRSLIENLNSYSRYYNIPFMYIYFPNSGVYLCNKGIFKNERFYDFFLKKSDFDYEQWNKFIENPEKAKTFQAIQLSNVFQQTSKCLLLNSHYTMEKEPLIIGCAVSFNSVFYTTQNAEWFKECDVTVTDENNYISIMLMHLGNDKNKFIEKSTSILMNGSPIEITISAPENIVEKGGLQLFTLIIALIAFLLILGYILTYCFKISIKPVSDVFNAFSLDTTHNTYQNLFDAISIYKNEKLKNEIMLKNQMTDKILSFLLQPSVPDYYIDFLHKHDIVFDKKYTSIAVLYTYDITKLCEHESEADLIQTFHETHYIIKNVFEELFSTSHSTCHLIVTEGFFVCIINSDSNDVEFYDVLVQKCREGIEILLKELNIEIVASISEFTENIKKLNVEYQNVTHHVLNLIVQNIRGCIPMNIEINNSVNAEYLFSMERVKTLENAFVVGNPNIIKYCVTSIIEELNQTSNTSIHTVKALLIDVTSCLLKLSNASTEEFYSAFSEIFKLSSLDDCKKWLLDFVAFICNNSFYKDKDLVESVTKKILNIISENFSDPNLNINMIAQKLNLTSAYISQLFKKEFDQSIVNVIQDYRVKNAKLLLQDPTLTIENVGYKAGFNHIRTFNRVFKKFEGITPSEFVEKQRTAN